MKGVLVLRDSTTLTGEITIPFEDDYNTYLNSADYIESPRFIKIKLTNKSIADTIALSYIKGYYMDSAFYPLKRVYLFVDQKEHLLFVKRLTDEHSRIQLYVLHQTGKSNPTGEETDDYFISVPASGPYETINTRTSKIIPDFDIKMSAIVEDCPTLANKIRDRVQGYFIPFVTVNRYKHKEVLTKIINEYNKCQ
jgi:hypothetical protein